eukprot:TRINITY_DN5605_c0_g1_i1.p1 TRINITY_DN5605_c0_g1~~TRINITY_DN5605_c0_g1_i1.p1  ORF type:complete len:250 (-),score=61.71 TRINITY_DN5605_c0_g1_i1:20-769(-)
MATKTNNKRKLRPYHRIKAHRNPLADGDFEYPTSPDMVEWAKNFPNVFAEGSNSVDGDGNQRQVEIADIGCGYGGLLVALGETFPDTLSVGMEIRTKVVEIVRNRIDEGRAEGKYNNIDVILTNAMKYLPNFFYKGQLKTIFFLFPDPHFKKSNHRRRIISQNLLAEYAYVLREGGRIYTVTDVPDLFEWMTRHLEKHPLFERIADADLVDDPVVPLILNRSEESNKVRNEGRESDVQHAVYQKIKVEE